MKLMIIESPGKVKKLTEILGPEWRVAASVGHVRDLPSHGKTESQIVAGIEADYKPVYEMSERGAEVIKRIKAMVKTAEQVYLATDPDREGESISWHLQQCLHLKNPLRVTFGEITKSAVKAALLNPRAIDTKRVGAQEARRVLDRLVGYMVSPELTRQQGTKLSAGRVQSVAVRLVVDRERVIRAFNQTIHFGAGLMFAYAKKTQPENVFAHAKNSDLDPVFAYAKTQGVWSANWVTVPEYATKDSPYVLDRMVAEKAAAVQEVEVLEYVESESRRSPPAPFVTSSLQQAANVKLGFDPAYTMQLAQKLFDNGFITYHRTDNPNVSAESLGDIFGVVTALGLDMADEPRKFKAHGAAQEGHPAITPTHWDKEVEGDHPDLQQLYRLIRIRAIASQLADAKYADRRAFLGSTRTNHLFEAKGRSLIYAGWLKLLQGDDTDDGEEPKEAANPIEKLRVGALITAESGDVKEKRTKAPARYTLASLVGKLEKEGIGRPATYASILENIQSRAYVSLYKKFLQPNALGETIVDAMASHYQFMELDYTREMEAELDRIAKGQSTYRSVVEKLHHQLEIEVAKQRTNIATKHPCLACGQSMRRIATKNAAFWGCSAHPICGTTLPDDKGKPGSAATGASAIFACALCSKPLIHRQKKGASGYNFWGCTGFKEGCRNSYPNLNGVPQLTNTE